MSNYFSSLMPTGDEAVDTELSDLIQKIIDFNDGAEDLQNDIVEAAVALENSLSNSSLDQDLEDEIMILVDRSKNVRPGTPVKLSRPDFDPLLLARLYEGDHTTGDGEMDLILEHLINSLAAIKQLDLKGQYEKFIQKYSEMELDESTQKALESLRAYTQSILPES
ncbi:MAG: hypothetical protein MRZ79_03265 [Bacteroidia bacterium]|nr:hypothetical protein [Bacteroidia bacterium]